MTTPGRALAWEGCFNVRDLGGLPTGSGGRTRRGAVVRADNVRSLTASGWQAALEHDVRRIVDLRFPDEVPGEAAAHEDVEVVSIPLLGTPDRQAARAYQERVRVAADVAPVFTAEYVHILERHAGHVADAVAAVAESEPDECVVVHCFAGKDRTGIVAALLLSAVGVPDTVVAEDYAASEPGVVALSVDWVAAAADPAEADLRNRFSLAPREAMIGMLGWLHGSAGGAERYLRDAGLQGEHVESLRVRLLEP